MANLFPTGYENEVVLLTDIDADKAVGYRSGVAFDYQLGDFPRDGMHKLMDSTGVESWKAWCINCLRTERGKHLAYNTDFGIDMDAAMKAESKEEAESILPAGSSIILNATDGQTYVKFTIQETGQKGTLEIQKEAGNYYYSINGMNESDCFEILPYAG